MQEWVSGRGGQGAFAILVSKTNAKSDPGRGRGADKDEARAPRDTAAGLPYLTVHYEYVAPAQQNVLREAMLLFVEPQ